MAISGRFVLLVLLGLVPVLLLPGWGSFFTVGAVLAAVAGADLALAGSPRLLRAVRSGPANVALNATAPATLTIHNGGRRRLRGSFRDAWQPSAGAANPIQLVDVPAGESRSAAVVLRPVRRGDLKSPHVTFRSFGPMRLAARQRTVACPGSIRVLPPFNSRRHLPSKLQKLRELDGKAAVQIRGAGTEFDSLRDYVRGDDVRSIDWRATARRSAVVVRTWRPERDRRVVMVLDTSRTAAARINDETRLDSGMEAALLLGVLAERGGDRVDFLAFDRRARARAGTAGKGNLLGRLVQAMAPLEPELIEMDWAAVPAQVRTVTAHRSLVVLLTSFDGGAQEEGLIPAAAQLSAQHVVVVAAVRDPQLGAMLAERSDAAGVFRAAAAERALLQRAAVSAELRRFGVEVVDAEPHQLPPRLADMYIRLKAAGRL
ncbi:protein of unknown function DUF58 [Pseudarthrobacter chlorophenolicus A6]|uniref:DUF58 domain-containing protein n=1 Tax=Pseudarthrobacter chlorophenolicus (strain ATCC 700700 / DSM 12829 / CIP 107037 / JCM 12360 / KCTC 9906 / NCIMB 13794 / A6) TaxID=452863 RepID=B8HBM5_PSECP|nr:DUF58 domain-containing protein [Pseudarthrobacter chlorophenolicus]ACL40413.1 protein of unknown function DUF58 [Pseudarthrobacter chlorophenolicus A6]SDQ82052.1 Uncharacterized conserved protein, DUF58 family, contains vWF domain [Pseudarthrobacter chlorophenolicus]